MTTDSQGPEKKPLTIEVTPEVIAFARAVIAAHEAAQPKKREPRYLFNVRSRTIHNRGCQAERWAVPLTWDQIAANPGDVIDCMACGSGGSRGLEPYDTVEVAA